MVDDSGRFGWPTASLGPYPQGIRLRDAYQLDKLNAAADVMSRTPVYTATTDENERTNESREPLYSTDDEIRNEQWCYNIAQKLVEMGEYCGQPITTECGLALITTLAGRRTILPPVHLSVAFKEAHDSIWGHHLHFRHILDCIAKLYSRQRMCPTVLQWVHGCHDCGSRKVRPGKRFGHRRALAVEMSATGGRSTSLASSPSRSVATDT